MRRAGTRLRGWISSRRDLVVWMLRRRSSRSLGQDELSLPRMTQSIDFAFVLDLHQCAGCEQLGAVDSSHYRIGRDAGGSKRSRSGAVRKLRVRSRVERSVHVRVARSGVPASQPQSLSVLAWSDKVFAVVGSIRCGETGGRWRSAMSISNANHSYSNSHRCQPRIVHAHAACFIRCLCAA